MPRSLVSVTRTPRIMEWSATDITATRRVFPSVLTKAIRDPPGVLLLVSSAAIPRRPCRCAAILTAEWLAPRWGKLRSARRGLQRSPRSPEHHHEAVGLAHHRSLVGDLIARIVGPSHCIALRHEADPVLLEVAARVFPVHPVAA